MYWPEENEYFNLSWSETSKEIITASDVVRSILETFRGWKVGIAFFANVKNMPKTKEAFSPINPMNTFSIIDYLKMK